MIVLERLDLQTREATLRVPTGTDDVLGAVRRTEECLGQLGVESIVLLSPAGREVRTRDAAARHQEAPYGDATLLSDVPHVAHRGRSDSGGFAYEARFAHRWESMWAISVYTSALLATREPQVPALHQIHLALYELCANVLEHGRPRVQPAEIELGLRLEPNAISGWIRDTCEAFDPTAATLQPLPENVDGHRRRGYGLHIVRRCLDVVTHRSDADGNRIEFRTELP